MIFTNRETTGFCINVEDLLGEKAVNLGDDTDTIAAVAGGLAGIIYGVGGERGIPDEWIVQIARKDWISDLCERFEMVEVSTSL